MEILGLWIKGTVRRDRKLPPTFRTTDRKLPTHQRSVRRVLQDGTAGQDFFKGVVGLVLRRRPDRFPKIIASRTPVPTRQKQEKTSPRRSPPSIDFGLRESSSHEVSTNFFSLHLLGIHVGRGCAEKEFGKSHPEGRR